MTGGRGRIIIVGFIQYVLYNNIIVHVTTPKRTFVCAVFSLAHLMNRGPCPFSAVFFSLIWDWGGAKTNTSATQNMPFPMLFQLRLGRIL